MSDRDFIAFAQTVGAAFIQLRQQIEEANQRLNSLGEPIVNVEPPSVTVGETQVTIDTDRIAAALEKLSTEGLEAGFAAIASAIGSQEAPEIDLTGLVGAVEGLNTQEALEVLSGRVSAISDAVNAQSEAILSIGAGVSAGIDAINRVVSQSEKVSGATQAQFTAILEAIQSSSADMRRAMTAPKRLIEEDGRPVGVETVLN